MSNYRENIERFVHKAAEYKYIRRLFEWIAQGENNQLRFLTCFNLVNIFSYLTAYWTPWIFLIWAIVVPALLFRTSPVTPMFHLVTMARNNEISFPSFLLTILFLMVTHICIFACLYMVFGVVVDTSGTAITGLWSHFYFSAVTYTTLGYGNLTPQGFGAEFIATIEVLMGFALFAFFIGLAATLATRREE